VNAVADACGIEERHAGLQPEEKCALLKGLQPEHKVAMLGDGINDLLTLVAADVGIAIGYAAEMNLESADIVITRNRITHLLKAIYISRLMMINVRRSLMWVGLYNVLAISLAVAGILTPVFSGIAMSVSSMIVVLNADRLKKDCAHISFEKIERLRMSRPLFRAGNTRGSRADSRAV
jgi:P-type E1-E2 ATPase